jgi:hypothetical protein
MALNPPPPDDAGEDLEHDQAAELEAQPPAPRACLIYPPPGHGPFGADRCPFCCTPETDDHGT